MYLWNSDDVSLYVSIYINPYSQQAQVGSPRKDWREESCLPMPPHRRPAPSQKMFLEGAGELKENRGENIPNKTLTYVI